MAHAHGGGSAQPPSWPRKSATTSLHRRASRARGSLSTPARAAPFEAIAGAVGDAHSHPRGLGPRQPDAVGGGDGVCFARARGCVFSSAGRVAGARNAFRARSAPAVDARRALARVLLRQPAPAHALIGGALPLLRGRHVRAERWPRLAARRRENAADCARRGGTRAQRRTVGAPATSCLCDAQGPGPHTVVRAASFPMQLCYTCPPPRGRMQLHAVA